jgi:hypothetical protein
MEISGIWAILWYFRKGPAGTDHYWYLAEGAALYGEVREGGIGGFQSQFFLYGVLKCFAQRNV